MVLNRPYMIHDSEILILISFHFDAFRFHIIALRASCSAVYCNRSCFLVCLFVCLFVGVWAGLLPR